MAIQFQCPHCQKGYKVGDEFADRQTNCSNCKKPMRIPAAPVAAAAPAGAGPSAPVAAPKAAPLATAAKPAVVVTPAAMAAKPAAPANNNTAAPVKPAAPPAPAAKATPPAPSPAAKPAAAPAPAPKAAPAAAPPAKPAAKPAPAAPPTPQATPAAKASPAPAAPAAKPPAPPPTPPAKPTPPKADGKPAMTTPTIQFTCSWCDAVVKVGLELEGKQTPCPECRRIVKVPAKVKEQPKDWRQVDKRPIPLKKDLENAPTDVWASGATASVSRESLEQAGAVTEESEPVSRAQWVKRGLIVALVVFVVGFGFMQVREWFATNDRDKAVLKALEAVDPPGQIKPEAAGAVRLGLAEVWRRSRLPDEAIKGYRAARGVVSQLQSPERDALLLDVTVQVFELGGGKLEIKERTALDWPLVRNELADMTAAQRSMVARGETIRQLFPKMTARQQDPSVLVGRFSIDDKPEGLALIGLERWRAGKPDDAAAIAEVAQREFEDAVNAAKTAGRPPPIAPSLVALWLVLGQPDKAKKLEPGKDDPRSDFAFNQGTVEAQARMGQLDAVRNWIQSRGALDQLRYAAIVAAVVLEKDPKDATDLQIAVKLAEELKGALAQPDQSGKPDVSWLLWRLVRAAIRAGDEASAKKLADLIPDTALQGRAQLAVVRFRLEKSTSKADEAMAEEVNKESPAYGLAREAIARHNARYAGLGTKAIDGWSDAAIKPLGYIGIALGIQDKEGR